MIKSFKYLKPYIWSVLAIFLLVAIRAVLNLALPMFLGNLLNDITSETLSHQQKVDSIILNVVLMTASTILGIVAIITSGYLESRTSSKYARDLRNALYAKVQQFSMTEMDQFQTSSLITRATNDIQSLQSTVNMLLRMVIMQPFMAIGAMVMAFVTQPTVSTILIFSILAVVGFLAILWAIAMPKFKTIQRLIDKMNLVTRENLSGLRVVRAFNTEEIQAAKTKKVAKESMDQNIFVSRLFNGMWPMLGFIMQLTTAALVYFAVESGILHMGSDFQAGDLTAMIQYGTQTIMNFMMISMILTMIPRASISANRVMSVIDAELSIKDPNNPLPFPEYLNGEIEFKNVNFKYPDADEPVLKNITFKAHPGKMTAFIGSTGSGKSTLINLVPRFYDPTDGEILVDGINIKNFKQEEYLRHIGYVPQKGILFKGTIESNVKFGNEDASMEDVIEATTIAQAHTFIKTFEDGYQTEISQGGTNVSGGQRQRLSIARAIAKKPKIYIFDDSFSALDYKTDKALRKALSEHIDATILVVAQRINTIRHADQIVVLEKGEIVGIGTHEELLKTCDVYLEIAQSQLSKEELGL